MRIGIVSTFPPYRGGIAQFNAAMKSALEEAGHDVQAITWSRQYPSFLFPGKSQWEPGRGPNDLTCPALLDSLAPWSWRQTGRVLATAGPPEVLILPFWHSALAPALAGVAAEARKQGVTQVVGLMHNASSHDGSLKDRWLAGQFMRSCDKLVTLSASVGESLKPWTSTSLFHPLYTHLDLGPSREIARERLGLDPNAHAHLFFGLIRPYKGLHVLLQALATLPPKHILVVAGECYGSWAPYAQQIQKLGLASRVVLHLDFVQDEEVPLFLSACDDIVLPYTAASQSGVTALALHHEVKVIASDVGDLGDTILPEVTGRLVPPSDPKELARAMSQKWPEDESATRDAFAEVKKRLSWSAWADQLMQQVASQEEATSPTDE
jgi:glycosyltransferase involved in cell wall biosynthesis